MSGRVLALDYGTARVGVAISDPLRITASPLEVVSAARAIERVRELAEEYRPAVIVIGLPVNLSGRETASAAAARSFGTAVSEATGIEVEYVDERFTTKTAERAMIEADVRRSTRRGKVDKVAAAVILRRYLEAQP